MQIFISLARANDFKREQDFFPLATCVIYSVEMLIFLKIQMQLISSNEL